MTCEVETPTCSQKPATVIGAVTATVPVGSLCQSLLQILQNILFFLNHRLRSVVLLRLRLLFKRALLHSLFVLLALSAAAVIQLREFVSFLIRVYALFDILLRRLGLHLGKCRTIIAAAALTRTSALSSLTLPVSCTLRSAVAVTARTSVVTTAALTVSCAVVSLPVATRSCVTIAARASVVTTAALTVSCAILSLSAALTVATRSCIAVSLTLRSCLAVFTRRR